MENVRLSTFSPEASVAASTSSQSDASRKELSPKNALLLDAEISALGNAVSQASSEAARIVTRRSWRKCLIGSEKEYSFLVRAILKYSTHHVFARVMEEHAEKMIEAARDEFLDLAIEARLKTIGAKELVAMLAKAGRLGYDETDVVDEDENVIPVQDKEAQESEPEIEEIPNPASQQRLPAAYGIDPLLEEQNRNMIAAASAAISAISHPSVTPPVSRPVLYPESRNANLPTRRKAGHSSHKYVCPDCQATFTQHGGLQYHVERRVCHKPPANCRWFCGACGKGFTTSGGKLYHEQNKVCASHETAKATPQRAPFQISPATVQQNHSHIQPSPMQQNGVTSANYVNGTNAPYPRPAVASALQPLPSHSQAQHTSSTYNGTPVTFKPANPSFSGSSQRIEPQTYHSHPPPRPGFQSSNRASVQASPTTSTTTAESLQSDALVLDAKAQDELNSKIATEVARFEQKCREIPDTLTAAEREEEINKQKRGHATRKSQIRKKYGIQVRSSKLRPANFGTGLSRELSPTQVPISQLSSFKAPPARMTSSMTISKPDSSAHVRTWPFVEVSNPKRRRFDDSSSTNNISSNGNRLDRDAIASGWQQQVIPLANGHDQSSEELESDVSSKLTKAPEQQVSTAKPHTKKVPVGAAQKRWEALQALRSEPPPPYQSRAVAEPSIITAKAAESAIVISTSDSDDESDFDPDEEIPARRPSGTVSRTRLSSSSISASPAPTTAPKGSIAAKGIMKRKGSGIFASSLPKGKMQPAIHV